MIATANFSLGRWDEALEFAGELESASELMRLGYLLAVARIQAGRGELDALKRTLELATSEIGSSNTEFANGPVVARAIALNALGSHREALEIALPVALSRSEVANEDRREAYVEAGTASLALDDQPTVERLVAFVADLPPALRTPLLRSGAARFAGLLAARRGDIEQADERLTSAARELRSIESPFVLGQVLLEHAELLHTVARDDEAAHLLAESREIFARLRATPWLQRASALEREGTAA
jgi:tetratricopeptide (TPR) repeat protein